MQVPNCSEPTRNYCPGCHMPVAELTLICSQFWHTVISGSDAIELSLAPCPHRQQQIIITSKKREREVYPGRGQRESMMTLAIFVITKVITVYLLPTLSTAKRRRRKKANIAGNTCRHSGTSDNGQKSTLVVSVGNGLLK